MVRFCLATPVLPGKLESLRDFDITRKGPRQHERDAFEKHLKTTKEIAWLQKTPQGNLRLVYYEGDADSLKWGVEEIAHMKDSYAGWMKSKWLEFAGLDWTKPSEELLAHFPEEVFAYEAKGVAAVGTRGMCLALPVVPGKSQVAREFYKTRMGPRWQEEDAWRKEGFKTSREFQWLQKTPRGDLLLIYGEWGGDFKERVEEFAHLQDEYSRWVKGKLSEITGIDLSKPFQGPLPEEIYAYEPKKVVTVHQ